MGGAPRLFQLRDPRPREIALELQADDVRLWGHGDPEHGPVRARRSATAVPNVATSRSVPQLPATERGGALRPRRSWRIRQCGRAAGAPPAHWSAPMAPTSGP